MIRDSRRAWQGAPLLLAAMQRLAGISLRVPAAAVAGAVASQHVRAGNAEPSHRPVSPTAARAEISVDDVRATGLGNTACPQGTSGVPAAACTSRGPPTGPPKTPKPQNPKPP